ncbi:MAG: type III-A CRISPR-associated RAMP protein Csm3 [Deltaproteobacteria bacterium]|jgi:CRISPR-associated protein Csm3|nr:type III-A CRISPR-associated RAMP protein Csm3 [Deltaproteobacteria bacterium]
MTVKLIGIEEMRGTLKVLESGLRIGGSKENIGIGETDNPIIRHPITNSPYVPGSSIKGKIRSLLELRDCRASQNYGTPCDCGECPVCNLFGHPHIKKREAPPSRLLFRDCQPNQTTIKDWQEAGRDSEVKMEVLIDRRSNTAKGNIGPRATERIPAGGEFDFSLVIRLFEGDDPSKFYRYLADGFELLGRDYLGGYGSRGYGHVAFVAEDGTPFSEYLRKKAGKAS